MVRKIERNSGKILKMVKKSKLIISQQINQKGHKESIVAVEKGNIMFR